MTKPTSAEWRPVQDELSRCYGKAYFRCDGFLICAEVVQLKMKLKIAVFVNGWMEVSKTWRGRMCDMGEMPEIPKKFQSVHKINVSKRQQELNIKIYGKREVTKRELNAPYVFTHTFFSSGAKFISHLRKNCDSIEILDYETYKAEKNLLEITDG